MHSDDDNQPLLAAGKTAYRGDMLTLPRAAAMIGINELTCVPGLWDTRLSTDGGWVLANGAAIISQWFMIDQLNLHIYVKDGSARGGGRMLPYYFLPLCSGKPCG